MSWAVALFRKGWVLRIMTERQRLLWCWVARGCWVSKGSTSVWQSRRRKVGLRSARAVTRKTPTTIGRIDYFRCGQPEHRQGDCGTQGSVTHKPGSHTGREARSARPLSNGRGAVGSQKRPGDTSSAGQKLGAGRPRNKRLARFILAIKRLSDTIRRQGDILRQ